MARTKYVISNVDTVKAQEYITGLLLRKKAKEILYKNERIWQLGNLWVGYKYLKVEYGYSEVIIYGWVPVGVLGGEQALTGFLNWQPKKVVKGVMKEIEVLLKRECGLGMTHPVMNVNNAAPVSLDPVQPVPVTPVQMSYGNPVQPAAENCALQAETIYKEAMSDWAKMLVTKENKDFTKSFQLFLQAANMGHAAAAYQVGYAYSTGWGVPKNAEIAFEWYLKSAQMGCCDGKRTVGRYYQEGTVVERDLQKAREWYQKAIADGDKRAQEWILELNN